MKVNKRIKTNDGSKTASSLNLFRQHSLTAAQIYHSHGDTKVLTLSAVEEWIAQCDKIQKWQGVLRELLSNKLTAKERSKLKKKLKRFEDTKRYVYSSLGEFDEFSFSLVWSIIENKRVSVIEMLEENQRCVPASILLFDIEKIEHIEKTMNIDSAKYQLSYWKDIDRDVYLDIVESMGKASDLLLEDTIFPLRIFEDIFTVNVRSAIINIELTRESVKNPNVVVYDGLPASLVTKHPCLTGVPVGLAVDRLLRFYTLAPNLLIELVGPNEICIPHNIIPRVLSTLQIDTFNN